MFETDDAKKMLWKSPLCIEDTPLDQRGDHIYASESAVSKFQIRIETVLALKKIKYL